MSNKSDELDRLLKQSALKVEEDIEQLLAHEQTQVGNAMRLHRAEIADRRNLSLASFFSMFKANYFLPSAVVTLVLILLLRAAPVEQSMDVSMGVSPDAKPGQYSLLLDDEDFSIGEALDYIEEQPQEGDEYSREYEWTEEDMQIDLAAMHIPLYLDDEEFDSDDA